MYEVRKWPTAIAMVAVALGGAPSASAAASPDSVRILSSRPDAISGGDALVQLRAPDDSKWSASLENRTVTASFRRTGSGEWRALLTGLKIGRNVLRVQVSGTPDVVMDLVNHPLSGPIFSGPHQEPFICQTQANGLGPAKDANCNGSTLVQYYYKSTAAIGLDSSGSRPAAPDLAPGFKAYDPSVPRPADVAQTTTADGRTVPYIVRREVGTINRAVYDIEFLHEPGQPLPTPWGRPASGWNGRLIYLVDDGCSPGYRQGTFAAAVGATAAPFLAEGYALATSTLNVTDNNCDDFISAETLSMVKEHFIETYGEPVYTMGWGGSGGAYNQLLTAQNYPGLLDGLMIGLSFPDPFTTVQSVTDCALLERAFDSSGQTWTEPQKAAVAGFATWQTCRTGWSFNLGGYWPIIDPRGLCAPVLPQETLYDRRARPHGVRCDLYDNEINALGRDPRTGTAYRPLDNVGVQYGLLAFNRGQIDAEQFIELNRHVGGFDDDAAIIPTRTAADPQAVSNAYRHGVVLTGGGGLSEVPIIDWRQYNDDNANNHDSIRSFIIRARLVASQGSADNYVILRFPRWSATDFMLSLAVHRWEDVYPEQARYVVHQMDHWLANIAADRSGGALADKVIRDKPADLGDSCWATNGERIAERAAPDDAERCNQLYPVHADPRIAAGGPLTDDILKCALEPVRAEDYAKPLTAAQLTRLKAIFPSGVCDYSRPGVGQGVTTTIWQHF